jgi:peroxiredoxin
MQLPPRWTKSVLAAAGLLHLAWALYVLLAPLDLFHRAGFPEPNYPEMVQELGLLAGVFGLGCLIAAANAFRYWPLVLMALLGNLGVLAGVVSAFLNGHAPATALWLGLLNNGLWIPSFAAILVLAYRSTLDHRRTVAPEVVKMAFRTRTQHQVTLDELSRLSPVLLVFLRHAGCTFCREALSDLAQARPSIEAEGARLVLVHMGTDEQGRALTSRYGLEDCPRISDPDRSLYRAFGLRRGSLGDLFGPKVWWRGFQAGILARHGIGALAGDGFQMPGVFLLYAGQVIRSHRHLSAADRPDYAALVIGGRYLQPEMS